MANKLEITHLATGALFKFNRDGLTSFNESYSSSWNPEKVFGKMDPILSYSNTERKISFSISVTAENDKKQAEALARIMYPTYSNKNALSLKEPPLIRVLFGNLIRAKNPTGLICAVESLEIDRGDRYFLENNYSSGTLTPARIVLQFSVIPLHEYDLGWFEVTDGKEEQAPRSPTDEGPGFVLDNNKDSNKRVYQFGSNKPQEIVFSSRKIDQVFDASNPAGLSATKKK